MKIAIIGPVHPYKGGIALHTTQLAHHLQSAGHDVDVISWKAQYPFFYPGEQFVPDGKPELPVFEKSKRVLSWKNPAGWVVWAKRLKRYDQIIFIWWLPTVQGPVYTTMMKALGKSGPRKVILCHNLIQHSAGPADKLLTKKVLNMADSIIVHTNEMAELASEFTDTPIRVSAMPAHLPGKPSIKQLNEPAKSLLFFGLVRQYKGVDILLRSLANIPAIKLVVAGEMWGKQQTKLLALIDELKLNDRVELKPGYVPAEDIADLFAASDALVMPYRSATASNNPDLAFANGRPVIATRVGSLQKQIRDKVDGLLCKPNDVESLSSAINYFYQPGVVNKLAANIPVVSSENDWYNYTQTITKID